jgi:hypothetical protein
VNDVSRVYTTVRGNADNYPEKDFLMHWFALSGPGGAVVQSLEYPKDTGFWDKVVMAIRDILPGESRSQITGLLLYGELAASLSADVFDRLFSVRHFISKTTLPNSESCRCVC